SSDDEAVATVTPEGAVTSRGDGQARIICSSGEFADTLPVEVFATVDSLEVSPGSATVAAGTSLTFTAALHDAAGNPIVTPRPVAWTSSAPGVATVDAAGVVVALAAGYAAIRAVSGEAADSALLTVVAAPSVETLAPA